MSSGAVPTLEELREELSEQAGAPSGERFGRPESLEDKILYKQEVLRKGFKDAHAEALIREVQTLLEKHGYALENHGIDGDFGDETEAAIIEFQSNNKSSGLVETGNVDGATLLALRSMTPVRKSTEKPSPHYGDSEDASNTNRGSTSSAKAVPSRMNLANISPKTKERLYKLTQAEVGLSLIHI